MSPKVFGVRSSPRPWPVAGASTITRSYFEPFFTRRSSWASSQTFPIGDQLAQAGRRGGEVGEDPVLEHQVVDRLDPDLHLQVLLQRPLRIDRERVQVLADLRLAVADALAMEDVRHALLLGDLAHDRALAVAGGGHAERGGDRGLADAALAGHEDRAACRGCRS